jgi:hypothetical protein
VGLGAIEMLRCLCNNVVSLLPPFAEGHGIAPLLVCLTRSGGTIVRFERLQHRGGFASAQRVGRGTRQVPPGGKKLVAVPAFQCPDQVRGSYASASRRGHYGTDRLTRPYAAVRSGTAPMPKIQTRLKLLSPWDFADMTYRDIGGSICSVAKGH